MIFYGSAVVAGALYAVLLEWLQRRYKILPYWTELEVIGGVLIVFAFTVWRIALGVPALVGADAAWWTVWQIKDILFAVGFPITIWQGWRIAKSYRDRLSTFLHYFWKDS